MEKAMTTPSGTTDPDDWRLNGQDEYLTGVILHYKPYRKLSETWNHEHCEFCWAKFMEAGDNVLGTLHSGYATEGDWQWICAECFADFKEKFAWKVIETMESSASENE